MRVDSYKVALFHRTIAYGAAGRCFTVAQIACFGADDGRATLIFYDPAHTITVPTSRSGPDNTLVFLPRDQFRAHLDLLRHEAPIELVTDHSVWFFGSLRTINKEPVGEGE